CWRESVDIGTFSEPAQNVYLLTRPPLRAATRLSSIKAAGRSATRRIMSVTFADGREVHDAPNKARQVCERPRDGERAVSRERPLSSDYEAYSFPPAQPRAARAALSRSVR